MRDRNLADYNLSDLYRQYAAATGINAPTASYQQEQPQTNYNRTPSGGGQAGGAAGVLNRNQAGVNPQNVAPQAQGQGQGQTSPYSLSEVQQQSLNQGVDRINAERTTAIANYRAQAAQQGMRPNPAMEQYINQHYDTMTNEATTQAAEAARAQREQAAAAMIQQFTNQRNVGTAQYGDSLNRVLQLAASALAQGAGTPLLSAANQTSGMAQNAGAMGQYNQQLANQSFGDMLQLIGFGAGGGFGSIFGGGGNRQTGGTPPFVPTGTGGIPDYLRNPFSGR